jgi:hypothetical protein
MNFSDQQTAVMSITNTTVSNNLSYMAGGILNLADNSISELTILASTISSNTAACTECTGGLRNVFDYFGSGMAIATLTGSIIANHPEGDCYSNAPVNNNGYNIIEDGGYFCGSTVDGDPGLGPLQDNGGPTLTHALLEGSPAINAIPTGSCMVSVDQRWVMRPIGAGCDIGAYEYGFLLYLPLVLR